MNKTTVKISVLAFLGFMTYGYAQQQQQDPYKGKVGVNTITPSATMDIRPSTANAQKEATTNEGIIAPKLSKTRIANIETPVEGTLVYATDETTSPISAYTGGDTKVAKITEKGYYYYNGTEWVKAGSDVTQQIWQKQANKEILLVDNDIQNTVKYTENGGLVNTPKISRNINTGNIIDGITEVDVKQGNNGTIENTGILNIKYIDEVPLKNGSDSRGLNANFLLVDEHNNNNSDKLISGQRNIVHVNKNANKNYTLLYGNLNMVQYYSPVKSNWTVGGWNLNEVNNGDITTITGALNQNSIETTGQNISLIEGTRSLNTITGQAKIKDVVSTRNMFYMLSTSSDKITNAVATRNDFYVLKDRSGSVPNSTITNMIGTHTTFSIPAEYNNITNQYGLKIDDVNKGTQINRAIHTEAGQIRFGDLKHSVSTNVASTGDRPVFVTADGVLKVGNASTALSRAVWETDGNHVKLAVKADGTDRTDNIITINDAGQMFASSFKGTNGATIFPDYVFQKYYTGTSSIKADYNFKSLSQVEDFVKTNGHLPGYKSAETIKAQGYVDLMETQLTNVEKIEELYLHSIEQDKALKAKESKIQELEAKNAALESRLERLEKLIQ